MRSLAIIIQVVSSAILQMSFIIYLSYLGGASAVAEYSYSLSLATVLTLFVFADAKSLVLKGAENTACSEYDWYVSISILVSALMVTVSFLVLGAFSALVFYLRVIQSVNEYHMACCLKNGNFKSVIFDSFLRLFFPLVLYLLFLNFSVESNYLLYFIIVALVFTIIACGVFGRLLAKVVFYLKSLSGDRVQLYRVAILPMSFTAAINMLPPYLFRDSIMFNFGAESLANFSISYQMLFSGIPIVAIFGQKFLIDNFDVKKSLIYGFVGIFFVSLLVSLASYLVLIINLFGLKSVLFNDVLSISKSDFLGMASFSIFMYLTSYVGYVFIKMNMLRLQMILNLAFCLSIAVVLYLFSYDSLASLVFSAGFVLLARLLFSLAAISRRMNVCGF